jgi:hypothetical protein
MSTAKSEAEESGRLRKKLKKILMQEDTHQKKSLRLTSEDKKEEIP